MTRRFPGGFFLTINFMAFFADAHIIQPMEKTQIKDKKLFRRHDSELIAHAGGGYRDMVYTNSVQALDTNTHVYDIFEMDFIFTADGELVCTHDWGETFTSIFGVNAEKPLVLSDFEQLACSHSGYRSCTAENVAEWMRKNPGKNVVVDSKDDNVRVLRYLAGRYPDLKHDFVGQIYHPVEYDQVAGMGFEGIMWTLYRYGRIDDFDAVAEEASRLNLWAVAMPLEYAQAGLALKLREELGLRSYIHTVNDYGLFEDLKGQGVYGIFTDWLK